MQKPLLEVVNGTGKAGLATKAVARKKESEKPKVEEVIVISPDDETKPKEKNPPNNHKESRVGSSRKPNKAFSSTLTARSKVHCS